MWACKRKRFVRSAYSLQTVPRLRGKLLGWERSCSTAQTNHNYAFFAVVQWTVPTQDKEKHESIYIIKYLKKNRSQWTMNLVKDFFKWKQTKPPERRGFQRGIKLRTICCNDVVITAIAAASKPVKFMCTSVTVHTPTPIMVTNTAIFTSRVYVLLCKNHSKRHTTGIILNLEICLTIEKQRYYLKSKYIAREHLLISQSKVTAWLRIATAVSWRDSTDLIEAHRVEHEAEVHTNDGSIWD